MLIEPLPLAYMKRYLLLLGLVGISTMAFAQQQTKFNIRAGFRVFGGGSYSLVKLNSYENFVGSYNTANASRLKTPLGNLRPGAGWCVGADGYIAFLYFNVIQNFSSASAKSVLKNGDSREFLLKYRPLDLNFDLMIPGKKKFAIGFALGMELQKATLYSGYRYANGRLSYAEDQPLNGIYRFRNSTRINAGLRMDYKVSKWLVFSLRAERIGFWAKLTEDVGFDPGYNLVPHRDEMMAGASSGPTNIDGTLHYYLPEDVANANNEYVYFVGTGGNTFANTYKGWRFMLTLQLNLKTWKLQ